MIVGFAVENLVKALLGSEHHFDINDEIERTGRLPQLLRTRDLLLEFTASSYRGELIRLPNTAEAIFMASSILEIVERRPVWHAIVTTTQR